MDYLIIAKQQATQNKRLNFYVTKNGIKNDGNLLGQTYVYKVVYTDKIHVYNFAGVELSQDSGNTANEKVSKSGKRKATKLPADSGELAG